MIQMMNVLGEKENVTTITNHLGKLLRFNLDNRNEVKLSEEIENVLQSGGKLLCKKGDIFERFTELIIK